MQLVRGLTPHLKEVHMVHKCPGAGLNDPESWQPWKGFTLDKERDRHSLGSLRFLGLSSYITIDRQVLGDWKRRTDFSVLRIFKLRASIDEAALDVLATRCILLSLQTLVLNLSAKDQYHEVINDYFVTVRAIFAVFRLY
jgi:hypothetical protein